MKTFCVTLPISGHICIDVDADDEEEAIEKALETATIDDIETWEAMRKFNAGNVCYCPKPWEAIAEEV